MTAVLGLMLLLTLCDAASAQVEADAEVASGPSFAFGVATEVLPVGFDLSAGWREGRRSGAVLSASFILPIVGILGAEGRAGIHARPSASVSEVAFLRTGVFTRSAANVGQGSYPSVDLRLRLADGPRSRWVGVVGAGWAGGAKDVPYVVTSAGLRGGGRVRWGVDLELTWYRTSWTTETAMYQDGAIVDVLATRTSRVWTHGVSGGAVLEIPVTRR